MNICIHIYGRSHEGLSRHRHKCSVYMRIIIRWFQFFNKPAQRIKITIKYFISQSVASIVFLVSFFLVYFFTSSCIEILGAFRNLNVHNTINKNAPYAAKKINHLSETLLLTIIQRELPQADKTKTIRNEDKFFR
jgi:hypothetical protein